MHLSCKLLHCNRLSNMYTSLVGTKLQSLTILAVIQIGCLFFDLGRYFKTLSTSQIALMYFSVWQVAKSFFLVTLSLSSSCVGSRHSSQSNPIFLASIFSNLPLTQLIQASWSSSLKVLHYMLYGVRWMMTSFISLAFKCRKGHFPSCLPQRSLWDEGSCCIFCSWKVRK